MKDIAFHLTDIAENSLHSGATEISITLILNGNELRMTICDNGCGMNQETLQQATNPFFTTRTTRKVGLGLPFLLQSSEQCGGRTEIRSEIGLGTYVEARFHTDHIDCPAMGDLAETFMLLITGNPTVRISLLLVNGQIRFATSTDDLIDGISAGHPQVAALIRELIRPKIQAIFGQDNFKEGH